MIDSKKPIGIPFYLKYGRKKSKRSHDTKKEKKEKHVEAEENPRNYKAEKTSLSIEETNKLRAKLGLAPLEVNNKDEDKESGSKVINSDENFVHAPAKNISGEKRQKVFEEKLSLQKERRKYLNKFDEIKGLAEEQSDEDDDASNWIKKIKDKQEAEKREKLFEEMEKDKDFEESKDENYQQGHPISLNVRDISYNNSKLPISSAKIEKSHSRYTSQNLKGLKVLHDVDEFKEGKTFVMTLSDKNVLEQNYADELENTNLVDDAKAKRNVELRKQKPVYDPLNNDEFDEDGQYVRNTILRKYDEEIEGIKKSSFLLGSDGNAVVNDRTNASFKTGYQSLKTGPYKIASEYYTTDEMETFKKPKSRKNKKFRKNKEELMKAEEIEKISKEEKYLNSKRRKLSEKDAEKVLKKDDEDDTNSTEEFNTEILIEEERAREDLEAELNRNRREKIQREIVNTGAIKVAQLIKSVSKAKDTVPSQASTVKNGSDEITLYTTSEFCRSLGDLPFTKRDLEDQNDEDEGGEDQYDNQDEDKDDSESASQSSNDEELEVGQSNPRKDKNEQDFSDEKKSSCWSAVKPNKVYSSARSTARNNENGGEEEDDASQLDQDSLTLEPNIEKGLGAALNLAVAKGYLKPETQTKEMSKRFKEMKAKRFRVEDKAHDFDDKFTRRMDRYNGPLTDFKEKKDYAPDFKLEYVDDTGKNVTPKEAFRMLSHRFHGKKPGKNKIEKRDKKRAERELLRKMASSETPLNTVARFQEKQKTSQQPYVILSASKNILQIDTLSKT